jgi:hypothetical protein
MASPPNTQFTSCGQADNLRTQYNALRAAFLALLAKMDTDFADVTNASVDYASVINDGSFSALTD